MLDISELYRRMSSTGRNAAPLATIELENVQSRQVMPSTLARLFHYAKATGAAAVENFTTEALAAAIRAESRPMVDALRSVGIEIPSARLEVNTQVATDAGILDVLLTAVGTRPVIIEVKVHATESGDQIRRYREWASSFPRGHEPRVVVLGPRRLTDADGVTWVSWQALWHQVHAGTLGPSWTDFALWLEELGMADDSYEPIDESEIASLGGAHRLLKKAARILTPVSTYLNDVWPGSNWPNDFKAVTRQIAGRFRHWPTYSVQHQTGYRCGLSAGIFHEDGHGWLGVWVWAPSKRVAERSRIGAIAKKLPVGWDYDAGHVELLGAYRRFDEFTDSIAASTWATVRIDELATAGVFALIEGFGREPEGDDAETD